MERLVTVKDVSERYGCSLATARKYIRQCNPHMERPVATYGWAFREWENNRTVIVNFKATDKQLKEIAKRMERVIVPRRR